MRRSVLLAVAAMFLSATASAAPDQERRFFRADVDEDGVVTAAEWNRASAQRFVEIDTDGSGDLSFAELAEVRRRPQRALLRLDANGDGSVSRSEWDLVARTRFAELDANGDGSVSWSELRGQRTGGSRPAPIVGPVSR